MDAKLVALLVGLVIASGCVEPEVAGPGTEGADPASAAGAAAYPHAYLLAADEVPAGLVLPPAMPDLPGDAGPENPALRRDSGDGFVEWTQWLAFEADDGGVVLRAMQFERTPPQNLGRSAAGCSLVTYREGNVMVSVLASTWDERALAVMDALEAKRPGLEMLCGPGQEPAGPLARIVLYPGIGDPRELATVRHEDGDALGWDRLRATVTFDGADVAVRWADARAGCDAASEGLPAGTFEDGDGVVVCAERPSGDGEVVVLLEDADGHVLLDAAVPYLAPRALAVPYAFGTRSETAAGPSPVVDRAEFWVVVPEGAGPLDLAGLAVVVEAAGERREARFDGPGAFEVAAGGGPVGADEAVRPEGDMFVLAVAGLALAPGTDVHVRFVPPEGEPVAIRFTTDEDYGEATRLPLYG